MFKGYIVFIWFVLCLLGHILARPILRLLFPRIPSLPDKSSHNWSNRCVSFSHSSLMSVLFIAYWGGMIDIVPSTKDRIGTYEWLCMDIMVGYLVYDLMFEIFSFLKSMTPKGGIARIEWNSIQIIFHHLLGLASHLSMQLLQCGTGSKYMMGIYGAELSTPFLHLLWFLTESKMKDSWAYFICGCSLLATFFWRNLLGGYIMYHLSTNWPLWADSTMRIGGINYDAVMFNSHIVITACFVMLNGLWTYKLVKKAFSSKKKAK